MICYDISARGKIQCTLAPPGSIRPPWGATALRNWASPEDITKYEITQYETIQNRVAQLAASLHPGCEKMERENEKVKRKWRKNEEMEREWRTGEIMRKWREIHSFTLYFLFLYQFPISKKVSHFVAKCQIRHFCRNCHKKLNTRAEKK